MKYVKMLGLAAVAAMALMAFLGAGSASATVLCTEEVKEGSCKSDEPAETAVESSLSGSAVLETLGGTTLDTCTKGTVSGKTGNTGGAGVAVSGEITSLTWGTAETPCTKTTDTLVNGSLSISYSSEHNGTVTGSGSQVTVNTIFGSCVYGTGSGVNLGTLKGGTTATIEINAIVLKAGGNATCPAETRWTASYTVSTPKPLYIENS